MNPNDVVEPAASVPFQPTSVAVRTLPLTLVVAFQAWDRPPGARSSDTVQPETPDGPAVTVTSPWYPPCHDPRVA